MRSADPDGEKCDLLTSIKNVFQIEMLRTATALMGGRFFNLFVSVILVFIQSRFIGPEITGVCQAYAIPIGYLWILTLGVPSALARELPYYLAKGEREKALQLTQTAQSFAVFVGGLCASVFVVLSVRSLILGNYLSAAGWGFQVIPAFFVIYSSYVQTLYRTTDEFVKIAKSNTIAAVMAIIVFPLIFVNPYVGLLAKSSATQLASNIYLYIKRPFKLAFGFERESFKPLVKFGLPLIAIGYIEASLWSSTQATLIFKMGGETYLGLFIFVNIILGSILIIPNAVADILRPRFAAVYGESGGDIRKTLRIAIKPLAAAMAVSIAAVIFSWLVIDDMIILLLPKYVDAVPAIGIALLIVPVMTLHCIKYIFVVSKNMKYNLLSTAPGFLAGTVSMYVLLSHGLSFKYIFLPYLIGQLLNLTITLLILIYALKKKGLEI